MDGFVSLLIHFSIVIEILFLARVDSQSCEFEVPFPTNASPAREETLGARFFSDEALDRALEPNDGQEAPTPEDTPSPKTFVDLSTGGDPASAPEASPSPPETITLNLRGRPGDGPLPESTSSGVDTPPVSVANPAPEQDVPLTPFEAPATAPPCPSDQECDTIRCGIISSVNVCCECLIRDADGKCAKDGWFTRDNLEEECALSVINNR